MERRNRFETLFAKQGVNAEEEQYLYQALTAERIPPDLGNPLVERMRYLRSLSEIRYGNLPIIRTSIHLDFDEHAHFEIQTTYIKPNKIPKPFERVGSSAPIKNVTSSHKMVNIATLSTGIMSVK